MITGPNRIIIVRHAESLRNVAKAGRMYYADDAARADIKGIPDHHIPLTELGVEQARKTGIAMRDRFGVPDIVFHSGYRRTEQTAEGLLGAYTDEERSRIGVKAHLFLRERDSGYTYEMTQGEVDQHFGWHQGHWDTFGGFFSRPVGGESLVEVAERTWHMLEHVNRTCDGKTVWFVTHGGTIRTLRYWLEGLAYEHVRSWPDGIHPDNCGVTVYEKGTEGYKLARFNEVCW